MNDVTVQIKFTKEENGYSFTDALSFTLEEYASITPEELESMKQQRFNDYVSFITNTAPIEPTNDNDTVLRLAQVKAALAFDEPVMNGILDAALQIAPNVQNRDELRTALLELG